MQFITEDGTIEIAVNHLTIAGWTGRDAAAVQHHIDELAAIGVTPPSQVPLFYQVSNTLLTCSNEVQMLGSASSGEAEPMLVKADGKLWLGLGSDHTDRELEATSVAASKQICQKPCAPNVWDFDRLKDNLDQLTIQSWIWENDGWHLYQDGNLGQILPLQKLMDLSDMPNNSAMMCGTFPAIGGVRASSKFRAILHDPIGNAEIQLEYTTQNLATIA